MRNYLQLLKECFYNGKDHIDRTGIGRRSVIVRQLRFNMDEGFPLVTTRKIYYNTLIKEMLWFISGSETTKALTSEGIKIWDLWTVKDSDITEYANSIPISESNKTLKMDLEEHLKDKIGTIGNIYGPNWRDAPQGLLNTSWPSVDKLDDIPSAKLAIFKSLYDTLSKEERDEVTLLNFCRLLYNSTVDQLNNLVIGLKERPFSSRHVVTAWIPSLIPFEKLSPQRNVLLGRGALAPCHMMFQCFVEEGLTKDTLELSLHLNIRSSDIPIGLPYNISQYALLLHMLAYSLDYKPKELIITVGDGHIYTNQLSNVETQLCRQPMTRPTIKISGPKDIFKLQFSDIKIAGYENHGVIDYPVNK